MSKVDFKVEPPIAYITFNSPDTLNAFNNHGAVTVVPYFVLSIHPGVQITTHLRTHLKRLKNDPTST